MMPRAAWLLVCAGVSQGAVACVTPAQNRQDTLIRVSRQYNDGLRWGRYQDVVAHLAADDAAKFLARTEALADDFEMADNEVSSVTFVEQGMRADITVSFTWYNLRRSLLRRTVVGQDWRFIDGRWICAAQRRLRGDRFPLIPEPLAAAVGRASPDGSAARLSPLSPPAALALPSP